MGPAAGFEKRNLRIMGPAAFFESEIYGLWVRRLFLKAKFTDYGLLSMFFFIFQTFSLNFQRFTPQVRVSVEA